MAERALWADSSGASFEGSVFALGQKFFRASRAGSRMLLW